MTNRTLIIAEAGVNHNGDMALARKLIDVAAEAGADLVKFQTFSADRQVTRTAAKADYQTRTTDGNESQHEMLRRLELSVEMHKELIAHCAKRNIGFFSTCFDIEGVDLARCRYAEARVGSRANGEAVGELEPRQFMAKENHPAGDLPPRHCLK